MNLLFVSVFVSLVYSVISIELQCPSPKVPGCHEPCPQTCEEPNKPPCPTKRCDETCVCPKEYVTDPVSGKCILKTKCPPKLQCPSPKVQGCSEPCPQTCDEPDKLPCPTFRCEETCVCPKEYVTDPVSGKCILRTDCPPKNSCTESEVVDCIDCERTCDNPDKTCTNSYGCVKGCVCNQTLIRDRATGQCVKQCPKTCPDGKIWSDCKPNCPRSCQSIKNNKKCNNYQKCTAGCVCPDNFILDEISQQCIPQDKCEEAKKCSEGKNRTYSSCASLCPRTCQSACNTDGRVCPAVCVWGCSCDSGYILDESTGKCILEDDCPDC